MSADGDIVRAALDQAWATDDDALAALARLEAAEARLGVEAEMHEAATEECREWQDAARTWQDNYNAAEAQRDALAEALRAIAERSLVAGHQSIARAALAEAGLDNPPSQMDEGVFT